MSANAVLDEIYALGHVTTAPGQTFPAEINGMSRGQSESLYRLVRLARPQVTLEVGMAFGLSSMTICQALRDQGVGRHIAMDPYQMEEGEGVSINGVGLRHLERAGLRDLVEFHCASSHLVLPRLEAAGTRIDLAFIDGSHLFDYTLLEFFYLDRMLRDDGLLIFDDADTLPVAKVVRYALTRGYADESRYLAPAWRQRASRVKRSLLTIPKALALMVRGDYLSTTIATQREHGMAVLRKARPEAHYARLTDWRAHQDF